MYYRVLRLRTRATQSFLPFGLGVVGQPVEPPVFSMLGDAAHLGRGRDLVLRPDRLARAVRPWAPVPAGGRRGDQEEARPVPPAAGIPGPGPPGRAGTRSPRVSVTSTRTVAQRGPVGRRARRMRRVAAATAGAHIRDSKSAAGPVVTVSRDAWAGFLGLPASSERSV
ncbi:DUF397 domain-containing protein [Streptomyces werraensis]|uniref:DUF397 domain-containing protein n=1 Tax=Streptomyces werraensis TaxID=68284 RepID=UPI0036FBDB0F